jgi:two-component system sensor histidine kinase UhpB
MIRDDGRGMTKAPAPTGLGIRGMQERVEGLGGRYRIDSEPGHGTCVRITIPLSEPEKTNEPDDSKMIGSSA